MGLSINTNLSSLNAQSNLRRARANVDQATERLSSGQRINRSSDDAAGLAISEHLKSQIRGLVQANRNASDGVSMIQTAEGGLNEVSNILVRLRELGIQSASDTMGQKEREYLNVEYGSLVEEVDRIASSTSFNDRRLLDGSGDKIDIQIGIFNQDGVDRYSYKPGETNIRANNLGLKGTSIASKNDAQAILQTVDEAINTVSTSRAGLGALQARLNSTINNIETYTENLSGANSRVRDADIAEETAKLASSNVKAQAATAVLVQANQNPNSVLQLIR